LREPFAADIAASLRALTAAGVPVHIARGNRDFLLGEAFARATGATLLPDELVVEAGGARLVVLHGDLLCTGDVDYQRYRTRMHAPATARRLLALPFALRRGIAWYLRRRSQAENARKPEAIMDVDAEAVAAAFRRHAVARMIHGHTHRPAHHALTVDGTPRERIVLSDWDDRGHYVEVSDAGLAVRDVTG
jgi:UDP-2,3-diacylglucosamine hydrolase